MQKKILGLLIGLFGLVYMACPNPANPIAEKTISLLAIPGVVAPILVIL